MAPQTKMLEVPIEDFGWPNERSDDLLSNGVMLPHATYPIPTFDAISRDNSTIVRTTQADA